MHAEVDELRPKLKEILYDCAVEIRATKAALFIYDGANHFELVTEYGFRGAIRESADRNDAMVDRCGRGRTPFYVNGMAAEPRFSQLLYESSTDRLLAAPLYSRGKLVGFIDMRDKAAKQLFEEADLPKAQAIAERLAEIFLDRNLFGHRFISLSNVATPDAPPPQQVPAGEKAEPPHPPAGAPLLARPAATVTAPPVLSSPAAAAPPRAQTRAHVPQLGALVLEARLASARILTTAPRDSISDAELAVVRDALRAILLLPGAVAATFSAYGHMGGVQEIAARSTLTDDAKNVLQSKLNLWLTKRGEGGGFLRTSVATPFGTSTPPVQAADVQKVFTAPLTAGAIRGLYLTVVFASGPERATHELLGTLHTHLQLVIEQSMQRRAADGLNAKIAEKLVEPDFAKFPELRRHSELVARLCESFARHLALTPAEVETVRIAAIVHDCGMRLLEYDRLYRKMDLSAEEVRFLREHPVVGAAMVEPLLGTEIARVVLCHHERVDGRGYPNQLHGDEIPLLARVLQICDAWMAMTDADSYQAPESRENAIATLGSVAGEQFDGALTTRFIEMIRSSR